MAELGRGWDEREIVVIAHDTNELFHLCDQPAVGAVDFFGRTVWLCAEHFDVFAPSYEEVFQ